MLQKISFLLSAKDIIIKCEVFLFCLKDLTPILRATGTPSSGASVISGRSSIRSSKEITVTKDANDNEETTQGDELRRLKTSRALRHPRSATTGGLK